NQICHLGDFDPYTIFNAFSGSVYDFIIVGSGSAGSVLANRLSENPKWKILLLEAGSRPNLFTDVPFAAPVFQLTPYNWGYTMEKQQGFCNAMEEGLCAWPRGRALGGSTVINYVIYTRGNPTDFDRWAARGNPGWSYGDVLPYYLKSENCNLGKECNSRYHQSGGWLSNEYPYATKLTDIFLRAGEELGEKIVDYNTPNFMGFSKIQANLKRGKRHSASAAFLDPISKRPNLDIVTSAKVTKILINPRNRQVYGVEFHRRGRTHRVKSKKEVVLSAGAFHSPQLLMLSGIGPKEHLEELGIPLVDDLPVGEVLYDHISFLGMIFTMNETVISHRNILNLTDALNWVATGKGVLSSLGGIETIAYIKTDESTETEGYPDIELLLSSQHRHDAVRLRHHLQEGIAVTQEFYDGYFRPLENKPCFSILPMLLHPKSRGRLKLRSDDPFDKPLLFGNYLTDPEKRDLRTLISSIRYIQRLARTEAFRGLRPGCTRRRCPCQPARWVPETTPESVVDNRLRVYGVKNLRVADTSIIPVTLSAHTSAPGMMIAPEYDFVIVGSGSSRSAVASRLSEVDKWKILVLEVGVPESDIIDVPLMAPTMQGTQYDWAYRTETLEHMGSCIEEGWSYKDVLPYFLKSEDARLKNVDYTYHRQGGYQNVENSYRSKMVDAVLKGGKEIGLEEIDYNAPTRSFGVAAIQTTTKKGGGRALLELFLAPTTKRSNLDILTKAFVTKILIDENDVAYGVVYEREGKVYEVKARKEVILAAGAINSPQLLMLSGIGPKDHLGQMGIKCRKDLPVGQNLQDHLMFLGLIASFPEYLAKGKGPISALGGIEAIGFIKTNVSKRVVDQPDVELIFNRGSIGSGVGLFTESLFKMKSECYKSCFGPIQFGYSWTLGQMLLHPKSVGYVKLASKKPRDAPLIQPRYYSDPDDQDIKTMIAGIRVCQKLATTEAFKGYGAELNRNPLYGCDKIEFDSDEYWGCALRAMSNTIYHPIGTTKMGPEDDPGAVVNTRLQVYGMKNLRVVDAGCAPTHISGHTSALAIMIGEKASDYIKEDWGELDGSPSGETLYVGTDSPGNANIIDETGNPEYDFIIIGGGSAGLVIASRLSEVKKWKILLLEAGSPENYSLAPTLQGSQYDWGYGTEKQEHMGTGFEDNIIPYPRGKALGGSSLLDYMIYTGGNNWDYDRWSENKNYDKNRYQYPLNTVQGTLGLPPNELPSATVAGENTAKAFLGATVNRTNLDILTDTLVTKILINDANQAYGIKFERKGKVFIAIARKEVVVSADLPVGQNLQDHLVFLGLIYTVPFDFNQTILGVLSRFPEYLFKGTGLFASAEGVGYVKTAVSEGRGDQPDIEMVFARSSLASGNGIFRQARRGMKLEHYNSVFLPLKKNSTWTIAPILLHPKSVGYVRLRSTDPRDPPIIQPNYYSDPENHDIKTMIAGIRTAQKLGNTEAFKNYGARINKHALFGCQEFDSDGYWECALRSISTTMGDPIGTTRIGPSGDPKAIVSSRLEVHGVGKLRVADAGCIPAHISGHTKAVATVIGKKVSGFIKEDWDSHHETPNFSSCDISTDMRGRLESASQPSSVDFNVIIERDKPNIRSIRPKRRLQLLAQGAGMEKQTENSETMAFPAQHYDFVIVGSGSAGSVLANRLSEIPHWRILLLEAGEPETELMRVPLLAASFQNTMYDWSDVMEYQPDVCRGLEGYRMAWPRGRALGGTSVINYMIYTRGNRWDYDNWATQGNPGNIIYWIYMWSYEDVLPYFIKSEGSRLRKADHHYHSTDGYLGVEDVYQSPLVEAFVRGGRELGLPYYDYNTPTYSFGVSTIQATVRNGKRSSAATAFLWPVRDRPNLDIVTSAFVTKVLIDETTREAYGVEFERMGERRTALATREVILSAGTFNSPQLLMLSGIGPRQHLEDLGIKCLQDSPVGANLQDHITFPGLSFPHRQRQDSSRRGPLTSLGGVEGIGYIKTPISTNPQDQPDMELIFVGGTLATDYGVATRVGMRIRDDVYDSIFRPIHHLHHWTVFPMLLHPKSVGWLRLRSANPYDRPLLYGNYFTDPNNDDVKALIAAVRFIQRLAETAAFQKFNSRLNPRPMAGCQHLTFDSDEYWECAIRSISVTLHHQVGTAKMGPPDDPGSVVNNFLQVYGVGRLRVADCSVIPQALSAHTNAPSTMVGEKAADIIKDHWGIPLV
ncbi:hypothetical protein NQ317_018254, partial [Molorchus minor]